MNLFLTVAKASHLCIFPLYNYHGIKKMKFSIKLFFSKCDEIRSFLRIWSHLLKKSLMENLIFCTVYNEVSKTLQSDIWLYVNFPACPYLLKVNNRNTRTRCEICSKLIIKILFLLLTLNM